MFGYVLVLVIVTSLQGVQLEVIYPVGYKGCYMDNINNRSLEKMLSTSNTNSGDACKQQCKDETNEYRYAGTENGNECFCGNNINEDLKMPEWDCLQICTGNKSEHCGGQARLSVYDTWLCSTEPCENGASCEDINGTVYNCTCTPGWEGNLCDKETATTNNTKIPTTEQSTSPVNIRTVTSDIHLTDTTTNTKIQTTETSTTAPVNIKTVTSDMYPTDTAKTTQIVTYVLVFLAVMVVVVAVIAAVICLKRRRGRRHEEADIQASVPTHNIYTGSLIDHETNHPLAADQDTNNICAGGNSTKPNGCITHASTKTRSGGHMPLNPRSNTSQEQDSEYNTLNSVSNTYHTYGDGYTYNHVNIGSVVDKTYSHLPATPCNSNDCNTTYSHAAKGAVQLKVKDADDDDETYNKLQIKNKLHADINLDTSVIEEAEYDHAVSEVQDKGTNETSENVDYDSVKTNTDKCIQEYVYATVVKTKT